MSGSTQETVKVLRVQYLTLAGPDNTEGYLQNAAGARFTLPKALPGKTQLAVKLDPSLQNK